MGYISNNNLINLLPLSTTQPHHGNDQHQLITAPTVELGDLRNNLPATTTSRWNPTPEQITTLEELYRSGIRTPTTEQIQQIASKLSKYGRIEGKNVFYWFQNHKARDRLKRRRRQGDDAISINNVCDPHKDLKDSSSGGHRVDQTKSYPCFQPTQPQDELVPANYNKDKNLNNEDHGTTEESQRPCEDGKNATWLNLVNSLVTQELGDRINSSDENEYNVNGEEETREIRTLNLFPVTDNQEKTDRFRDKEMNTKANQVCCNDCYYYEFMPLKN